MWHCTSIRAGSGSHTTMLVMIMVTLLGWDTRFVEASDAAYAESRPKTCVPIEMGLCKDIGYNKTYLPNYLNHGSQEEAELELMHFKALIDINCFEDLRLFLCSFYAPICVDTWPKRLPACRSLCLKARDRCLPVMRDYEYKWPDKLRCDSLPDGNECVSKSSQAVGRSPNKTNIPANNPSNGPNNGSLARSAVLLGVPGSTGSTNHCECLCRPPLLLDPREQFDKVVTGGVRKCLMNCHSPYFYNIDSSFPTFWLGLWSCLCLASTSVTIATFLIDRHTRFQYPERPIIFLAVCYWFVSLGYIVRLVLGHERVACQIEDTVHQLPQQMLLRYGSSGSVACSIVFLLIYFFSCAAATWWVVLTATWFMASGLKWSSEAIAMYADVYHFMCWFVPGLLSILVLTLSSVDGDPVAGICLVGNTSTGNLLAFLIVPLCVCLLAGTGFLAAGFSALLRIRRAIRRSGQTKTDKLEKLMARIGVFGAVYSVPAACVIVCYLYELLHRARWEARHNCVCASSSQVAGAADSSDSGSRPEYAVFMLKYFMQLVVGTTSGFWIWTNKTLEAWKRFFRGFLDCCFCCHSQANVRLAGPSQFTLSQLQLHQQQQQQQQLQQQHNNLHSRYSAGGKYRGLEQQYSHPHPPPLPPPQLLPETLSTKALLAASNKHQQSGSNGGSSYNLTTAAAASRSARSSSLMVRSAVTNYTSTSAPHTSAAAAVSSEIGTDHLSQMISLTHV